MSFASPTRPRHDRSTCYYVTTTTSHYHALELQHRQIDADLRGQASSKTASTRCSLCSLSGHACLGRCLAVFDARARQIAQGATAIGMSLSRGCPARSSWQGRPGLRSMGIANRRTRMRPGRAGRPPRSMPSLLVCDWNQLLDIARSFDQRPYFTSGGSQLIAHNRPPYPDSCPATSRSDLCM